MKQKIALLLVNKTITFTKTYFRTIFNQISRIQDIQQTSHVDKKEGKQLTNLIWGFTCSDTHAPSYIKETSEQAEAAAELAAH